MCCCELRRPNILGDTAAVVSRHRIGVSSHGSFQRTEYADVERLSDVRGMGRKHHEVNGVRDAESDEFGFDMTAVAVDNKKTSCNIADSRTWLEYVLEPFVCKDVDGKLERGLSGLHDENNLSDCEARQLDVKNRGDESVS